MDTREKKLKPKSLGKRIARSAFFQSLLANLIAFYIWFFGKTCKWQVELPEESRTILESNPNVIGCFWHGRMLMMCHAWPYSSKKNFHMLISAHRDGRFIADAIENLGFSTIEGSSRRGGASALIGITRALRKGGAVGFTPDGPKGPRMRAKAGAIKAAQMAGVPVIPVSGSLGSARFLSTWDRFCLPRPFSKGLILWGKPIHVPRDADDSLLEEKRQELEEALNALTRESDRRMGQPEVFPDEDQGEKERAKT
ncbi:lysophospholipid acyltransferase family protein [Kiloniella sp. b19]|uniref:lysophospholipid acyltransferase family protein n=1 Tax=Kiloniella sp. GXU_MW_B19 TaxID=3141326 RepID=UPI0031D45C48